jgi:hypothetical protein
MIVLGITVSVGVAGVSAWQARVGTSSGEKMALAPAVGPDSTNVTLPSDTVAPASLTTSPSPSADAPEAGAGTEAGRKTSIAPVIPIGRTALRDTMVADRTGDTVRVDFDLTLSRTRRADKFEWIMRTTLPQVFGGLADSALRAFPDGSVARAGDLVATLPVQGIRIPLTDGRAISVWPETRPGRDGPIVVAYRAVAYR